MAWLARYFFQWEKDQDEYDSYLTSITDLPMSSGKAYGKKNKKGELHGKGDVTFKNREFYVGEFKHDKFDGEAIFELANDRFYIGHFKEHRFEGYGQYYAPRERMHCYYTG